MPSGTEIVTEMAPVKSCERLLPITEFTQQCFEKQLELQKRQKRLNTGYFDNNLVAALPNGAPEHRSRISRGFGQLLRHNDMPHMRFHDTRHTAATNMHELTGDIYTVSQILGHSTKGIATHLNIQAGISSVTAGYVDVRLDRKLIVLNAYHQVVCGE